MHQNEKINNIRDLFQTMGGLETKSLLNFLQDILSVEEIKDLALRWQVIKALDSDELQRKISENLGCSMTIVARGSRQLKYGHGGFKAALKKLRKI